MNLRRCRRWAGTLVVLGLLLMVVTAVAMAEEPTPTPTPTEPTAPATPIVEPTVVATLTPEPTATATATATATPARTATPTPTTTATPTPTANWVVEAPRGTVRQAPTPTATPTAAPTGALMTICAYTGNPDQLFVPVVIAADEYSPYFDDENTIIPAPYYGCEGITGNTIDDAAREPTTLCHVTGDPARPYEFVQLPNGESGGHEFHPGDLIPAPNRACPGAGGVPDGEYPVPTATATATPDETSTPTVTAEPTTTPDVLPDDDGSDDGRPLEDVLDDLAGSGPAATQTSASSLPFTGADVWLLFATGLSFVLMGAGMRLLSPNPA